MPPPPPTPFVEVIGRYAINAARKKKGGLAAWAVE